MASFWKIQWVDKDGNPAYKKKLYETEKAFNKYWKHHASMVDYLNKIGLKECIIGYKDGIEIRRHPSPK